jgi:CHAT domain-containing protein
VDDILALPRSPRWVVLAGCEAGASSEASAVESLGLAHAFVGAGARAVIAPVRPVPDRETAALMQALYRRLVVVGSPPEALRQALLAERLRGASAARSGFRVFVP